MNSKRKPLSSYELMECIDEGLSHFGPGVRNSVYWRMIVQGEAPKEGIVAKSEAFVDALRSIFGESSKQIERAIVEEISLRTGANYNESEKLAELIKAVRKESIVLALN